MGGKLGKLEQVNEAINEEHPWKLDKIIESAKVSHMYSLRVLYHFDETKSGALSTTEYQNMQRFFDQLVQDVSPKMEEKKEVNSTERASLKKTVSSVEMFDAQTKSYHSEEDLMPLIIKGLGLSKNHIQTDEDRNTFMEWLFLLSDTDATGNITTRNLKHFLMAAKQDNVDLHSLLFDVQREDADIVELVMAEYSQAQGYLTKEDFFQLGSIILSVYESSQNYFADGKGVQKVGDWVLRHVLGKGAYGVVYYGTHHYNGQVRAIKAIKKGNVSDMSRLDVEIKSMKLLKHPNIVELIEVTQDEKFIYLHMPVCEGGDIYKHLASKPFEEPSARYYFHQLIDGLEYCHQKGVCHRDLRIQNLLLSEKGNLKISDFGQARIFSGGWDLFSTQLCGSLFHISPEQVHGKVYSGEKMDLWNVGIVLYCFLTGCLPFCSDDETELFQDIVNARFTYPKNINVSDEAKDLISSLLQQDPEKRISLKEIRSHPWYNKKCEKLSFTKYEAKLESKKKIDKVEIEKTLKNICQQNGVHCIYTHRTKKSNASPNNVNDNPPQEVEKKNNLVAKCINPIVFLKFKMEIELLETNAITCKFQFASGSTNDFKKCVRRIIKNFHIEMNKE